MGFMYVSVLSRLRTHSHLFFLSLGNEDPPPPFHLTYILPLPLRLGGTAYQFNYRVRIFIDRFFVLQLIMHACMTMPNT